MRRTVVLHHDLPSGACHFDWLLQSSPDPQALVTTFRTRSRPDSPSTLVFTAERISDHRAFYLDHEGKVPGGRGTVRRLAEGRIVDWILEPHRAFLAVEFERGLCKFQGALRAGGCWVFERLDAPAPKLA